MVDNHDAWLAELAKRKQVAGIVEAIKEAKRLTRELEVAAKPKKFRECDCTLNCNSIIDTSTPKLKKTIKNFGLSVVKRSVTLGRVLNILVCFIFICYSAERLRIIGYDIL